MIKQLLGAVLCTVMVGCAHSKSSDQETASEVSGPMQKLDPVFLVEGGSGKDCRGDADCPSGELCYPQTDRCIPSYPNPRMLNISLLDRDACKAVSLYFPYDSIEIVEDAQRWLQYNVRCLKARDAKELTLRGHADSRGPATYNQKLSIDRGEAVKTELGKLGLDIPISVVGYGERAPLRPGKNEKDYAFNRRVEFVIK